MPPEQPDEEPMSYGSIWRSYEPWHEEPKVVPKGWAQSRGYAFEKILNALVTLEGLSPRTNYRPDGEEIDGSIVIDHRTYLLEFKWWKSPLPASQLYAFKGKLDGKLSGTIGIFISHSGYSEDAIDALKIGKEITMILFDKADLQWVLRERISFTDAVRLKLRYAAEYGQPFRPLYPDEDSATVIASSGTSSPDLTEVTHVEQPPMFDVVVEGSADESALRIFADRLDPDTAQRVRIWRAGGARNLVPLADNLVQSGHTHIAMFMDLSDQTAEEAARAVKKAADLGVQVVGFESTFIDLLEDVCDLDYYNALLSTGVPDKHARRMASHADLELALEKSPALLNWWSDLSRVKESASPPAR